MKTLKTFAIIAFTILIVSCKKDKQQTQEPVCRVTAIKTNSDSTIISYASGKVNSIYTMNGSDSTTINFVDEGGYHKEYVIYNNVAVPGSVNYTLNAIGYIDRFQQTIITPAVYVNTFSCKYDTDGHLIWLENAVTKSGSAFNATKDSFVYENGNLTKKYVFRTPMGSITNYSLYSTTLINYSNIENTAGLYVNQLYAPENIQGTSNYYYQNFPFITHLYGKGSKNAPINSTTSITGPSTTYNGYDYTFDADNRIVSQTITRSPASVSYPKTNRFYYTCN